MRELLPQAATANDEKAGIAPQRVAYQDRCCELGNALTVNRTSDDPVWPVACRPVARKER